MAVAYDAFTDAQELAGDGVLSLSHTATGSDLAVCAGVLGISVPGPTSTSVTYGGAGMTEQWDLAADVARQVAGYSLANPATGSQTVTSTLSTATPLDHALGVISMTGVHQTVPVGTANTAAADSATPSVTVASIGADDLVIDAMLCNDASTTITAGADQTERVSENTTNGRLRMSTQPGTAGGVMSWSIDFSSPWAIGAIAFKPSTAATAGFGPLLGGYRNRHVLHARI